MVLELGLLEVKLLVRRRKKSTASKEITSMYTENSTTTKTQYVDEKMKGIITNPRQISGCVFNISVKF